jgi:manganese efflux pump family protein
MGIAALILWIITAGGGFFLLAKWVAGGGHRQSSATKFPPALIFGHFLLAAAGLVLWIVYLVIKNAPTGWVALIVLAPVAVLGFTMLRLWIPSYRNRRVPASAGGSGAPPTSDAPERSFPIAVVTAHGVLAVTTVVLVLLTMLNIGTA